MIKNTELTIKINICLDQIDEFRVYNYLKLTDSNSDGPIVHGDRSKVEGKLSFLVQKVQMVRNVLIFKLFIEIIFRKVGLFI